MKQLIENMESYCERAKNFDGSKEQFCNLFRDGIDLLKLNTEDIVKLFSCNTQTIRRYKQGKTAPAKSYRFLVVKTLLNLVDKMRIADEKYAERLSAIGIK
jgi:hypothetical protein